MSKHRQQQAPAQVRVTEGYPAAPSACRLPTDLPTYTAQGLDRGPCGGVGLPEPISLQGRAMCWALKPAQVKNQ